MPFPYTLPITIGVENNNSSNMSLPEVTINIGNGGLGGVEATADGVAGMIVSMPIQPGPSWADGYKQFFSIDEVKDSGLHPEYDEDNSVNSFAQIADFYNVAGDGAELWVMGVPRTETLEDICDASSTHAYAKALLDVAGGTIRLLGVCRVPDANYTPSYTNGVDDDVVEGLTKLNSLANTYAGNMQPFVGIVEGRAFQGNTGTLIDLTGLGFNRVAAVIAGGGSATGISFANSAGVGLLLGRLAADPVQRKAGRVKTGAVPVTAAYFSNGSAVTRGVAGAVDAKGWITMTPYPQRSGFYWANDHTCAAATDDYSSITNRRVVDKAMLIAYDTYVEELLDEILIDTETGKIAASVVKYFEGKITNAVNSLMTAEGEISGMTAYINPEQNILSTGKLVVNLSIVPVGYTKTIEVKLGFSNPATA